MTVVAYNQDRQWDIPGYVWPAVLGVSVALHVSALIYGLPALPWTEEAPLPPVETEVILESGGLPFEDLASVETEITQPLEPDTPLPVETSVPVETVVNSETAEILEPVLSEPVVTESPVNALVEAVPVTVLDQSLSDDTPIIEAQEVSPVQTSPVTATPPEQLQVIQPSVVPQTASTVVAATPVPDAVVAVTSVAPNVIAGSEVTLSGAEVPATVEVVPSVAVATDIGEVAAAGETQTIVSAVQESPVLAPLAVDQPAAEATGNEVVSEVFVPQTQPSVESPGVVAPDTSVTVNPVVSVEADAVLPAEQQVAALQPTETETPELAPNAPVSSTVPATQPQGELTENVPPVAVASIDPLAKVSDYVAGYKFGECTHMSVLAAGADTAEVTAFGAGIAPFAIFDQRFKADQGFEAKIEVRLVTRRQCALLDALGVSEGIEAAGLVELDRTVVRSGTPVSGVIQRDLPIERIASAEQSGLDLSGKGPPELYLIDDAGQIHDGREFLLPASNSQTAGGWRFKVPVTMIASDKSDETALVLAIWNRPSERQPSRFGRLPSERVAEILAEPGVYSLTAFKVSR
ncbi:hypothetical protein HEP89_23240 [Labrenzia sp. 5N]|uniref:hypothetical protein n=1 Tax=Labrenzia sp. 5N TaxID=2723402 RepID=UPI0014466680|nr:hypothetical protein [Labrenzia sp. 5N]NKX67040.1 hypothetical protein [Labrenzia sp. 5N]